MGIKTKDYIKEFTMEYVLVKLDYSKFKSKREGDPEKSTFEKVTRPTIDPEEFDEKLALAVRSSKLEEIVSTVGGEEFAYIITVDPNEKGPLVQRLMAVMGVANVLVLKTKPTD